MAVLMVAGALVRIRFLRALGRSCVCAHGIGELALPLSDDLQRLLLLLKVQQAFLAVRSGASRLADA